MVFKQSFKYLKNETINFIKVILKLEFFFPLEYIYIYVNQTWNLHNHGIFSTNYIIIVKKYFKRPNKIYIFRISSTRFTKCRDLRNFLKFKKIEVINFFFLIFKEFFAFWKIWLRFLHHFVDLVELILTIYILLGLIKYFFTIII